MGDEQGSIRVVTGARDGVGRAPAREDVWCVRGEARALIVEDLAVGDATIDARLVTYGFGVDVWDLGDRLLARVADGWRATDADEGEGAQRERFFVSGDCGRSWAELDPSDARDFEHRRVEDALVARVDRWPASWC